MTIELRMEIVASGHCLHVAKFMRSFKQPFFSRGFDMFVFGLLGSTYWEDKSLRPFFFHSMNFSHILYNSDY